MFDRETVKMLHQEIDDMTREIAKKHGYEFAPSSASYSETEVRFGFSFQTTNASGETRIEADFKTHAKMFDLNPEWLHKIIEDGDKRLEVAGLDLNKTKNVVILLERGSGKRFKAPADFVKYRMKAQIEKEQNDPNLHLPSYGLEG